MIKEKFLIFRKVEKPEAKEVPGKPVGPSTAPASERADLADASALELMETTPEEIPELSVEQRAKLVIEALVHSYTNDEKIRALFNPTKMNLDIALDALMKIKPAIVKRLEEGYKFESYSEDGLICHWSKAGQKISEINPIFKQEGILNMMDQNARRSLEGLKNAIIIERVKRYIDQHIFSHIKKFRPNLGRDSFYSSYLIREEVIPILAAGYEEGARPYEFIPTAQGFQLKSDITVFHTHDFVLSDYDWSLNLRIVRIKRPEPALEESAEEWKEYLKESFDNLVTEENRKQAEEETLIEQATEDNFAAENAAIDKLYDKYGNPDNINPDDLPKLRDDIYGEMAHLAGRNELVGEDNADIQEYLEYLYTQTNGGTIVPDDLHERRAMSEGWPGFQELEDETRGAWYIAQQRGDYESLAAMRTYNRFAQYFIQSLGFGHH